MNPSLALIAFFLLVADTMNAATTTKTGYAPVNGLKMYYEIHGEGKVATKSALPPPPLVLLHGGGSTIESTFGRILLMLAKSRKVIAVELQAHGHTKDIDRPETFENDADDVAQLLKQLNIPKADFFGFSNGGTTCLQIAIRYPTIVNKLIVASGAYKRDGFIAGFFDGFNGATLKSMPQPLQDAYYNARPDDAAGLQTMFDRDVARMKAFKDIPDEQIKSIAAPTLILNAQKDVVTVEHALEMSHALQHAELAILPGGHGEYIGEICSPDRDSKMPALVTEMILEFLEK